MNLFFLKDLFTNKSVQVFNAESHSSSLPDNWKTQRKLFADATILEFFNLAEVAGLIQVCSYSHSDQQHRINLEDELVKANEYAKAKLYKIGRMTLFFY